MGANPNEIKVSFINLKDGFAVIPQTFIPFY